MINRTQLAALQTLFDMARQDRLADLSLLANELGLTCVQADRLLEQLHRAGLVDGDRVRLTMAGLTVAATARHTRRVEKRGAKDHLAA